MKLASEILKKAAVNLAAHDLGVSRQPISAALNVADNTQILGHSDLSALASGDL